MKNINEGMEYYGWSWWQTGGNCTAYGYVFEDGRTLMLTSLEDELGVPTRWWNEAIVIGLYDPDGDWIEDYEFSSVNEFINAWI